MNNAGIVNRGNSWELSLEDWRRVIDVESWGVIHGIRSFVPRILASGEEGHIVNTASMAAVLGTTALGPYTVAKHGVLGLSDVLRAELDAIGAPIGVSVVMPGMIRTGMNPIGSVAASTVAANIVDAILRRRAYVFTDDHHTDEVEARLRRSSRRAPTCAPDPPLRDVDGRRLLDDPDRVARPHVAVEHVSDRAEHDLCDVLSLARVERREARLRGRARIDREIPVVGVGVAVPRVDRTEQEAGRD